MKNIFKNLALVLVLGCSSFSSVAFAEVYYNDPTQDTLWDDFTYKLSLADIRQGAKNGDPKAEYLLGELYLTYTEVVDISQDYDKALPLLQSSWKKHGADAGHALFRVYYNGLGVKKDLSVAFKYLQESAEMGYTLSQRDLAEAYRGKDYEGLVGQDYEEAIYWYKKAAAQGDKNSALAMANLYYQGEGVKQSNEKAFEWLLRCSKLKYGYETQGFRSLAKFYEEGIGTDVDLIQAYKYYDLRGSAGAEGKQLLSKQMTKEQIEEARRQSLEWQKEHNVRIGGGFFQMN
ncbi:tetratricopeptide repeat protein [Salinicola sp. CPA57]|uniref:tetratricopeptide repeat protein n=1 Tax=Salinicola sp. CPA57 TaxID=1949080 RepID=UPI000DA129ED|nr:tetratricopeptide repeat protein [Salinicola sp. CPA57]